MPSLLIRGGLVVTIGYSERFFTVADSLNLVAIAVIGGLGSLAGAVTGALWVIGLPSFWPNNDTVLLLTSSIGLLIVLLYFPGGFTQIGYALRGSILDWLEKRLPERAMKTSSARSTTSLSGFARLAAAIRACRMVCSTSINAATAPRGSFQMRSPARTKSAPAAANS